MKPRIVSGVYLTLHIVVLALLFPIALLLYLRQRFIVGGVAVQFIIPTMLHIVLSFLATFPSRRLPDTSRNELERRLLPLAFLNLSLMNIFLVIPFNAQRYILKIPYTFIGRLYIFAISFFFSLFLFLALFQFAINTSKFRTYISITFLANVLVAATLPLSVTLHIEEPSLWFSPYLYTIFALLALLAIISFIALALKERELFNLLENSSSVLIVLGNFLYVIRLESITMWIGLSLFAVGIILSIPRERFAQLQ